MDDDSRVAAATAQGHPMLWYTLARIGLFVVVAGVLYLLGARSWMLLILALLASGVLSLILLGRLRDAVSVRVAERVERRREQRTQAQAAEDDLL